MANNLFILARRANLFAKFCCSISSSSSTARFASSSIPSSSSFSESLNSSAGMLVLFKYLSFSILSTRAASSSISLLSCFAGPSSSLSNSSSFARPSFLAPSLLSAATSSSNLRLPLAVPTPPAIPPRFPSYPSLIRRIISLCRSFSSLRFKSFRAMSPASSSPSLSEISSTMFSKSSSSASSPPSSSSSAFCLASRVNPKSSNPATPSSSSSSSASASTKLPLRAFCFLCCSASFFSIAFQAAFLGLFWDSFFAELESSNSASPSFSSWSSFAGVISSESAISLVSIGTLNSSSSSNNVDIACV
mmetsp:Transcript_5078/g.7736  ORF Transcript_5078/g.7736 Transcript_5078/m.7736 type:complete len:305 (+) Transcript_5078:651-1565(+)